MLSFSDIEAMTGLMEKIIQDKVLMQQFEEKEVPKDIIGRLWRNASTQLTQKEREETTMLLFHSHQKQLIEKEIIQCTTADKDLWGKEMQKMYNKIPLHILVITNGIYREKVQEALHRFQMYAVRENLGMVMKGIEYRFSSGFLNAVGAVPEKEVVKTLHLGFIQR